MNKQDLQNIIAKCHEEGKLVSATFCSHVPQEILEAADIYNLRIPYMRDVKDSASQILIRNVCPVVKNVCDICEDPALDNIDLIFAETSCDGKKKMYELLSNQNKLYFYQVGQGADRDYVRPLIKSEVKFLRRELKKRFDIDVTDDAIREAAVLVNKERESIMNLMELQKTKPAAAWGKEIFEAIDSARVLPRIEDRIAFLEKAKEAFLAKETPVKKGARRILITGCPLSGTYDKIIDAVENNGGVVVAFENCEVAKAAVRHFDVTNEDVPEAFADCYQKTGCAIMSPNYVRFDLIRQFVDEYKVDGVLDITLQTCHPYTVEKDKMSRLCEDELGIPYMVVETDCGEADRGQLETRITAFIEML